jgi:hypothetical protein
VAGWLDASFVAEVLGADIMSDVDTAVMDVHADAVRSWVEDRRPDVVFGAAEGDEPAVSSHLRVAAAMLAYRCYRSRSYPEDELGQAPELSAMLGIGKGRRFSFGGAATVTP